MPYDAENTLRHDWSVEETESLFNLPFNDLILRAQTLHRQYFDANQVQMSTLLSVKTGGCPEDCAYCPQSAGHDAGIKAEKLMAVEDVLAAAKEARDEGSTRYCMGAAWRNPKDKDLDDICAMVEGVSALGLESCATLGMLTDAQAARLADAGLDYY
ncbi:MAG: biotin synthase, partial [Rhodospirillales bacterium]|nr:biotin synthase [Rhodospirillales bacterium]